MPGFVDVSNMSSEEIRRMGHADDYDDPRDNPYAYRNLARRNPYAYRKPIVKKPSFSYDADKVWGAAVVAFRINKGYVKAIAPGIESHKTNRQLVEELLKDNVPILDSDIEEGRKIRQYFKGLTFKVIEGKSLTPFLKTAMETSDLEQIDNNLSLATIVCLPATYNKMNERDDVDRKIKWARGGFIGTKGDNITQTIEVVKQIYSQKWNTWYITGLTDDDKVLFFAYKSDMKIGDRVTIKGTVKDHRDNSTQLNRVKVL